MKTHAKPRSAPVLLSVKAAAEALGIAVTALYEHRRHGVVRFQGRRVDVEESRAALLAAGMTVKRAGGGRPLGVLPTVTKAEAIRRRLVAQAEMAELALRVKRGALIDRELAERKVYELATASRDSWLTWPSDDAQGIAADLGIADVGLVRRVLEKWVRARLGRLRDIVVRLAS